MKLSQFLIAISISYVLGALIGYVVAVIHSYESCLAWQAAATLETQAMCREMPAAARDMFCEPPDAWAERSFCRNETERAFGFWAALAVRRPSTPPTPQDHRVRGLGRL